LKGNWEWWKALLSLLGTLLSVATPFVFRYGRRAWKRGKELIDKIDTLHAQVLPNGGKSLDDKITKQGEKLNAMAELVTLTARRQRLMMKQSNALLFEADGKGDWLLVSYKLAELCGLPPNEMHGRGWLRVVAEADRERVWAAWSRAVREDIPYAQTFQLAHYLTEATMRVHAKAEVLRTDEGAVLRYQGEIEILPTTGE
jgi:PAS domain S-box-containing protein